MTTPDGTFIVLGAVITTNSTPRGVIKRRCTGGHGQPAVGAGSRVARLCWYPWPHCKHQRDLRQGSLCSKNQPVFLAPVFVLYTVKYIYTFICLMLSMQSLRIALEEFAYAVLIRALLYQLPRYRRCAQPLCLPKRATNRITLSKFSRKHLYSTITF